MYKCSHFLMIVISGLIWGVIGVMLMTLGMHHLMDSIRLWDEVLLASNFSVVKLLGSLLKNPQAVLFSLVAFSILLGYLKGQFVLLRSVKSGVQRILSYPNPSEIKNIYAKKYYLIIFGMMGLGMVLRASKIPQDIHGMVDLAIGSALLKGALTYFKYAFLEKKGTLVHEKW